MKLAKARLRQIIKEEVEAEVDALKGFGSKTTTQSAQARSGLERSKSIAKGDSLGGVENRERAMLMQIEKALTSIAEKDDLIKYRSVLQTVLKKLLAASDKAAAKGS
jgi:hypothetical protein|tara:strand:- start:126 stop:446 length:321 start_codon:yes stop_codon:yes gene_type:complete